MIASYEEQIRFHAVNITPLIIGVLAGELPDCMALPADQLSLPVNAQHLVRIDADALIDALGFDEVQIQQRAFAALLGAPGAPELRLQVSQMLDEYADRVGAVMAQERVAA